MIRDPKASLFDLAVITSEAVDVVSPQLANHHKRVAYIAAALGEELGWERQAVMDLVLAGLLHDIGALSLTERIDLLRFEADNVTGHCTVGKALLGSYAALSRLAPVVRYHHYHWNEGSGLEHRGQPVPPAAHLLHAADRVAVMLQPGEPAVTQGATIVGRIAQESGRMFMPEAVEALKSVGERECFWLDAVSPALYRYLRERVTEGNVVLGMAQLGDLASFLARIIDFRSRFTATHSAGVAATACALAKLCHFSERECATMRIAGWLHDLGKLAVSREILEKPAKLTTEEFSIVRAHTYHTFRILDTLEGFETIASWAAFHHERLNGRGYPFHHDQHVLSLGSRIMAVADVYTALTETRPYRPAMAFWDAVKVLNTMAEAGSLDPGIVELLGAHAKDVDQVRLAEQEAHGALYIEAATPQSQ